MIASGDLKSIDVLNMIETKRAELAKNLTINDLEKGDFIGLTLFRLKKKYGIEY